MANVCTCCLSLNGFEVHCQGKPWGHPGPCDAQVVLGDQTAVRIQWKARAWTMDDIRKMVQEDEPAICSDCGSPDHGRCR